VWSRIIGSRRNESTLFQCKMCVRRKNSQEVVISGKNSGLLNEIKAMFPRQGGNGVEDSTTDGRMCPTKIRT